MQNERRNIQTGWRVVLFRFEGFFHLELQLQTHARKVTLEGWRRNKTIKHHRLLSMDLASLQGLSELRLTRIYGILETVSTFSWL